MNGELTDALQDFVATESRLAELEAADPQREIARLTARVSRRRVVRQGGAVVSAAAVTVVAVALAVGGDAGRDAAPVPPAVPAPTSSSEPAPPPVPPAPQPVPIPASTPTGAVAAHPSLPAAEPMSPGMLASTDPGWRLVRYQTQVTPEGEMSPVGVYLVSPDGRAYDVPAGRDAATWYLEDWLPGTSLAVVHTADGASTQVIDLLTGATVLDLGTGWGQARFVGDGTQDVVHSVRAAGTAVTTRRVTVSGAVRATGPAVEVPYGTDPWVMSREASALVVNDVAGPRVLRSADLTTVARPAPYPDRPGACRAWSWVSDTEVLLECAHGGAEDFAVGTPSELWLSTVSGGAHRLDGVPEAQRLGGVWRLDGRLVAGTYGPSEAEAAWWELRPGAMSALSSGGTPALTVVDVRGSELLVVRRAPGADPATSTASLDALDPVSGAVRTLLSTPEGLNSSFAVAPASLRPPPQTDIGD